MSTAAATEISLYASDMPSSLEAQADGRFTAGRDSQFVAAQIIDFNQQNEAPKASQTPLFDSLPVFARYGIFVRGLEFLMKGPEADEFGLIRPSLAGLTRARTILFDAAKAGYFLPEPEDIGTDHDGDIRISWRIGERFLELIVPYDSARSPYLYYSERDTYDVNTSIDTEALTKRLTWVQYRS